MDLNRLIDVIPCRSAAAVSEWLRAKPDRWLAGIATAVIDAYSGYARGLAGPTPAWWWTTSTAVRLANPVHCVGVLIGMTAVAVR